MLGALAGMAVSVAGGLTLKSDPLHAAVARSNERARTKLILVIPVGFICKP
jgi:hypothetical protein